eukprot:GILJ01003956.1.p1 GENE.GILJ01003956.1~~GILJ01003956.1.p1  ORF type:complete len:328 (+),score=46.64 GILJ01003956.1:32-1015(+)
MSIMFPSSMSKRSTDRFPLATAAAPAAVNLPFWAKCLSAGFAASIAEVCTIPIDTAKVRLQTQADPNPGEVRKYRGMMQTIRTIASEEGATAPWKGLSPGIQRQMVFASLRIGLYEPVRNFYCGKDFQGDPPLLKKIAAGLTTGTIGICVASPTDLVKIRLQGEGRLPPGVPRRYNGSIHAYKTIIQQEGVAGLWTGLGPNIARNATINAAELASYDQLKQMILSSGLMGDNVYTHFISAFGAGFIATCVGSPVDVIKTRVMNAKKVGDGSGPTYTGALDCALKTARNEGIMAFYKGFVPNFMRIGTWNIVMFISLEQIRAAMSRNL